MARKLIIGDLASLPTSLAAATARGERFYFDGVACGRGHLGARDAKQRGACVECKRAFFRKRQERRRQQDPKRYLAQARKSTRALRAAGVDWKSQNPERAKEYNRAYVIAHPAVERARWARRRAAKRNAIPSWNTETDTAIVSRLYREATLMTRCLGRRFEVDHVVPLQGGTVCGLHAPNNLRVVLAHINNRRPRIWDPNQEAA